MQHQALVHEATSFTLSNSRVAHIVRCVPPGHSLCCVHLRKLLYAQWPLLSTGNDAVIPNCVV